jgi:hypothetical protein
MKKENKDYTPHYLTHVPGGTRLLIVYESGKTFSQNNCHYPERYLKTLLNNPEVEPIREAFYKGKPFYFNGKFNLS